MDGTVEEAVLLFDVHADNSQTVDVFMALQTQWRIIAGGMGGVTYQGIDYASIPGVLSMLSVPRAQRAEVFAGLRVMEGTAIKLINRKADADA